MIAPIALSLALAAQIAPVSGDADFEEFARVLVDPVRLASGDRDGTVRDWIERARGAPGHPLAEAALLLVEAVRADLDDPPAFRREVLSLDPTDDWTPAARRVLERLRARAASLSVSALASEPPDGLPFVLSAWDVLGPLGPANDPRALLAHTDLFAEPGFQRTHPGVTREVAWRAHDRSPWATFADPLDEIERSGGTALLAARFDVDVGGPAWLEWDFGTSAGNDEDATRGAPFAYGGASFADASEWSPSDALFAWAFDRGAPELVDRLDEPSGVLRRPVVLRAGRNELLLSVFDDSSLRWAVRVLDAEGRPLAVRGAHDDRPLGARVDAATPTRPVTGSLDVLLARSELGPDAEGLLGLLLALDGRAHEGRAHLEACARSMRPGLLLLAAGVIEAQSGLPRAVRASRARELRERAASLADPWLSAGIADATRLVAEDRQAAAVEQLARLGDLQRVQVSSLLAASTLLSSLDLPVLADRALEEARRRAPESPRVLASLATRAAELGREGDALVLLEAAVRSDGPTPQALEALATRAAAAGRRDLADRSWRAALVRDGDRRRSLRHAHFLSESGRPELALEECAGLAAKYPEWAAPRELAVDAAQRLGDESRERALLVEAVALRPASTSLRERMSNLGMAEPVSDFVRTHATDVDALLAVYDGTGRDDSLVDVLDEGLVFLFADGSAETITHSVQQPRDLDAADALGKLVLRGDVLRVRSLKPDGAEYEPIPVGGRYVLPNLEPGDLVETRTRVRTPPTTPLRPGRWTFASTGAARVLSRYVVRVPKSLELRLETRRFEGLHETFDDGDAVVHVFETRDLPRVLRERGSPPDASLLPWVEFGQDENQEAALERARAAMRRLTTVTPELAEAAADVAARVASGGEASQAATARELLRLVQQTLDESVPLPVPALVAWLSRRGHPATLYASLLDAAGIARDLVWTRDVAPAADADPDPPFAASAWIQRRLLVRVLPDDGPATLCDPDGLPYGVLRGNAPGAETLEMAAGSRGRLPEGDEPGTWVSLAVHLGRDGVGLVDGTLRWLGGPGFLLEGPLAEWRESSRRAWIGQVLSSLTTGFDLTGYALPSSPDDDQPAELRFTGRAESFVEADGSCRLPLQRLRLSSEITAGDARRLPYRSETVGARRDRILFDLDGYELVGWPEPLELACGGWSWSLALREGKDGAPVLVREFVQRPFELSPDVYGELVDFCARVDAVERGRLQFRRVP